MVTLPCRKRVIVDMQVKPLIDQSISPGKINTLQLVICKPKLRMVQRVVEPYLDSNVCPPTLPQKVV